MPPPLERFVEPLRGDTRVRRFGADAARERVELFHLGHPVNMQIVEFIHQRLLILRKGFRATEIFIPLPVIELWQRILQVGPRLFGGKFLAGHVLHADLDQIV